jgi:hypothetical protein
MKQSRIIPLILGLLGGCCLAADSPGKDLGREEAVKALPQTVSGQEIHVKEFGAIGDGKTDDGPAILRALETAALGRNNRVIFEKKTYFLGPKKDRWPYFVIANAENLTIEGCGAELNITVNNTFFEITHSSGVQLKNITLDYSTPTLFQGRVTTVDSAPTNFSFDVQIDQGFPAPPSDPSRVGEGGGQHGFVFMPNVYKARVECGGHFFADKITDLGGGAYRFYPKSKYLKGMKNIQHGDRMTYGGLLSELPAEYKNPQRLRIGRYCAVAIVSSSGILLEDVNLYGAWTMGIEVANNEGGLIFRRVNIKRRSGSQRLLAVPSSPMDIRSNRVGPVIEDCVFESGNDDLIGLINTAEAVVVELAAPVAGGGSRFRVDNPGKINAREGDILLFRAHPSVKDVDVSVARHLIMENSVVLGTATIKALTAGVITVDKEIEGIANGNLVLNLNRSHEGLIVRNNTFRPLMRQAMQLRTLSTALIENNVVEGLGNCVALSCCSPWPKDIKILNNNFKDLNIWGIRFGSTFYQRASGSVIISNNHISMLGGIGIYIHRQIDNVQLLNNEIQMHGGTIAGQAVFLEAAYETAINGLKISDPRPTAKSAILATKIKKEYVTITNVDAKLAPGVPVFLFK